MEMFAAGRLWSFELCQRPCGLWCRLAAHCLLPKQLARVLKYIFERKAKLTHGYLTRGGATKAIQTDHVTFTGADEIRRMFTDFFAASASITHELRNVVVEEATGKVATEQGYIGELKDGTKNDMHNCNFFSFAGDGRFKRVIIWMAGTNPLK